MAHLHHDAFRLAAELEETRAVDVYRQVLACRGCRRALDELGRWLIELDHCRPLVGPELKTSGHFFEKLTGHEGQERRLAAVRLDELFHHWGLCNRLLRESACARISSPQESTHFAELGQEVARHLDHDFYGREWVADLEATAAAALAECARRDQEYRVAHQHLVSAREQLQRGTGRRAPAARVAIVEARLLRAEGRHEEVLPRLEPVLAHMEASEGPTRRPLDWLLRPLPKPEEHGRATPFLAS